MAQSAGRYMHKDFVEQCRYLRLPERGRTGYLWPRCSLTLRWSDGASAQVSIKGHDLISRFHVV
jgi:hypothetical protein